MTTQEAITRDKIINVCAKLYCELHDIASVIIAKLKMENEELKKFLPQVNDEYQCKHVKENVIEGSCVWCHLTVAEKGLKEQREQKQQLQSELAKKDERIRELDEEVIKWRYEVGQLKNACREILKCDEPNQTLEAQGKE